MKKINWYVAPISLLFTLIMQYRTYESMQTGNLGLPFTPEISMGIAGIMLAIATALNDTRLAQNNSELERSAKQLALNGCIMVIMAYCVVFSLNYFANSELPLTLSLVTAPIIIMGFYNFILGIHMHKRSNEI